MEKRKTNMLSELIDDVIVEQQKLRENCKREGIPKDMVIFIFLARS